MKSPSQPTQKFSKIKSVILVGVQFGILAFLFVYSDLTGSWASNLIGLAGMILGVWAVLTMRLRVNIFPDVRASQELFVVGPYKSIRHPMYTAVLMIALALVVNRSSPISVCGWIILLIVLLVKLNYEEKLLADKFKDYKDYASKTKKLMPLVY